MNNYFLKVNKDLFNLELSPIELLVLAQVMEFDTNTNNCFITDEQLAKQFNVSTKTISRSMKSLEEKGYIKRDTKSKKGGKSRTIEFLKHNIDKALTKDKMSLEEKEEEFRKDNLSLDNGQNDFSTTDKLSFDNGQNDLIKDNIKDKEKEKIKDNKENYNLSATLQDYNFLPSQKKIDTMSLLSIGIDYEALENAKTEEEKYRAMGF